MTSDIGVLATNDNGCVVSGDLKWLVALATMNSRLTVGFDMRRERVRVALATRSRVALSRVFAPATDDRFGRRPISLSVRVHWQWNSSWLKQLK